ncbi:MAG: SulP family inorganic anion transporter [Myxococcales bacterium]|nr:SulP family inorganic anion transporter [Myxococcales bacterium]
MNTKNHPSSRSLFGIPLGDITASVVVFLVALPLCMGVAIASGVPPALGLVTGMIGGLVVAFFAGQPLQVSGPAAGLTVLVWDLVQQFGLGALGLAVLIGGLIQLAAGFAGVGRWFRAVSPAVIQGMLTGIGVLIFASQFHVMVDDSPRGGGLLNLLSIPEAIYKGFYPMGTNHHMAASVGLVTVLGTIGWNRYRPGRLAGLPGPLVGVALGTSMAGVLGMSISYVQVPRNLVSSLNWIGPEQLELLKVPAFWTSIVGLAMIASAETLLCATAVDRMHDGQRTNYDKELRAQGLGNALCGLCGALPMTGVIVRSSANVEAGAKTRWSAVLHGAWIAALVLAAPGVLSLIPTASLAAVLVYTGWKLVGIPAVKALAAKSRGELVIWAVTVGMIVSTDLLVGVATGFALALLRLISSFAMLEVEIERGDDGRYDVTLVGAATFISLPKLAEALETLPRTADVHVHIDGLAVVDHACMDLVEDWYERHQGEVVLEQAHLLAKNRRGAFLASQVPRANGSLRAL